MVAGLIFDMFYLDFSIGLAFDSTGFWTLFFKLFGSYFNTCFVNIFRGIIYPTFYLIYVVLPCIKQLTLAFYWIIPIGMSFSNFNLPDCDRSKSNIRSTHNFPNSKFANDNTSIVHISSDTAANNLIAMCHAISVDSFGNCLFVAKLKKFLKAKWVWRYVRWDLLARRDWIFAAIYIIWILNMDEYLWIKEEKK